MHRGASQDKIFKIIDRARKIIPGVGLRTSIIVGFPGETEKDFKELLKFIKDTKFERLGAFRYSREEGTKAYHLPRQVPESVKSERFNQVMSSQQAVSQEANQRFIGKKLRVLIDEPSGGCYIGRSQFDAPEVDGVVYVHSKSKHKSGDFVNLRVTDTLEYDLVGEVDNEFS